MLQTKTIDKLAPRDDAYYVADGKVAGLALAVHPSGKKVWTLRYRVKRQQRRLTLGVYDKDRLSLDAARKLANRKLREVDTGVDPAAAKRADRDAVTFATLSELYLTEWAKKRKRSWKEDERRITKHLRPWKHRAVTDITRRDVRLLIEAIATDAPVEANRVQSLVSKMLNFALDKELITANPMLRMRKQKETARQRVLSADEIRKLWTRCDALDASLAAFFKLRLVTAQRGIEVASMRWRDLDLDARLWTIPPTIAKNGLAHRVPLSQPAVDIITALKPAVCLADGYVLDGGRGKRQQAEAAAAFGLVDFQGKDLRRTAASLMAAHGVPRLIVQKILNHVEKGITAVYERHGYDAEKRAALDHWSRVLTAILEKRDTNVLPFTATGR